MLTGFHGLHVLIGTIFLIICSLRAFYGHFEDGYYIGSECAIWYWHFVDIVWLFLYIFVYIWGRTVRIVGIYTLPAYERDIGFPYESFDKADFSVPGQISFQDPASFVMENIILLHNYVMFFLILIFSLVVWFFTVIIILQKRMSGYNYNYIGTLNNYYKFRSDLMSCVWGRTSNIYEPSGRTDIVNRIREV